MNQIFWCLFIIFVGGVVCFFDLFIRATLFKNKYQSPQGGFISEVEIDEQIAKVKRDYARPSRINAILNKDEIINLKADLKQCRETNKSLTHNMQSMVSASMIRTNAKKEGDNDE